jgi:hypothetical protein
LEPEPDDKPSTQENRIARLNHPLRDVKHLLSVLEAFDWKISIRQALEDDEAWQDDIILLKGLGERYKHIRGIADGSITDGSE